MKPLNIIILVVLAVFIVGLGLNFSQSASIYTDFSNAKTTDKQVHIVGKWVNREQSQYHPERDLFQFYLQDTTQHVELINYYEPKPTNFENAEKVVVVGAYKPEGFVAEKIVMKCPSKFEATDLKQNESTDL
ncbi:MAG: cytochrome c maturation protein CcmE [Bacteroidia bacterium]|nr:cytochrome c maturation protein CcmE [Bacteroidia bacterium]